LRRQFALAAQDFEYRLCVGLASDDQPIDFTEFDRVAGATVGSETREWLP
jgi:hypothetical protein